MKRVKADTAGEWQTLPLGDVFKPNRPRVSPSEKPELPFIGMEHVEAHTMKLLGTVPAQTMKSSSVHFQPGDVLYGRLRPYLNKVYRPDCEGLCSAEFIVFPTTEGVDGKYLQYFLNSNDFVTFATHLNEGDRPRVDFKQIAPYPFPLPPLPQQRRIVEAIELQLGRLDAAVARLQGAKARLKRYKQAVLKAAVEGGDWDTVPLRELIQEGRKIAYGVLKPGPHVVDGVRFIKSGQVRDGEMDLTEDYRISKALDQEFHRTRLQGGEVLLNLVGASIGRSAVAPDELKGANVTRAIAVIPVLREKARWVQLVLNTPYGQEHMLGKTGGNAQPVLNLAVVKDIPIPLPAEKEMEEVVTRTREQLFATSEMEATLDAQLQQAVRLRQAVLKRAFEGRLG